MNLQVIKGFGGYCLWGLAVLNRIGGLDVEFRRFGFGLRVSFGPGVEALGGKDMISSVIIFEFYKYVMLYHIKLYYIISHYSIL